MSPPVVAHRPKRSMASPTSDVPINIPVTQCSKPSRLWSMHLTMTALETHGSHSSKLSAAANGISSGISKRNICFGASNGRSATLIGIATLARGSIVRMIGNKERSYRQEAARQLQRQREQYLKQAWLGKLTVQIMYQAVDIIAKQHRLALAAMPDQQDSKPLRHCTGTFKHQYGLPCSHTILDCLTNGTPLRRSQIAARWWLEKPLVCLLVMS